MIKYFEKKPFFILVENYDKIANCDTMQLSCEKHNFSANDIDMELSRT